MALVLLYTMDVTPQKNPLCSVFFFTELVVEHLFKTTCPTGDFYEHFLSRSFENDYFLTKCTGGCRPLIISVCCHLHFFLIKIHWKQLFLYLHHFLYLITLHLSNEFL